MRSKYNEERKEKNMEMLSKDETVKKSLLPSCCVAALLPETPHLTYVAVICNNEEGCLLFILFSHPEINLGQLHLGEQY